jgi:phosphoadenosine phosphosulfate reductase
MDNELSAPLLVRIREAQSYQGRIPSIDFLNQAFTPLGPMERLHLLYAFFREEEVLVTSSFGTKSAYLLYLIHLMRPTQKVYFIDTTYHFPETLAYRDALTARFGLEVEDVLPNEAENAITREEEWWKSHPRMCCAVNKVAPLEPIKGLHKVWISGLMAYQTDFRSRLRVFEQQGDILKFHPLIDIAEETFEQEMERLQLPRHPLEAEGFGSVGCTHCTAPGNGREGRWKATGHTECGLHPGYFKK